MSAYKMGNHEKNLAAEIAVSQGKTPQPRAPPAFPIRSQSTRTITLKIMGTDKELKYPCKVSTTVEEMQAFLEDMTLLEPGIIQLYYKQGAYVKRQVISQQIAQVTLIKGIEDFSPPKMKWPHPTGIIGGGYHGQKTAMHYVIDGNEDFVLFDRQESWGGYCWITGANKTSRLQTEMGSFHIWYGDHTIRSGRSDWLNCNEDHKNNPMSWHIWPYKAELNEHFNMCAKKYGLDAHMNWNSNVSSMRIRGDKKSEDRVYELTVTSLKDQRTREIPVSLFWSFPGSLTKNRIIDYPGERDFGGEIRYGMNDDTPYDKLEGSTIAILGNGAFAVENARTCLECGGKKAYLITRRKNLACPRMPSWFVHQAPLPIPGAMLLKAFGKMYEISNFGDPWSYWSVHANAARTNVSIIQNSRFGIGDVTFLMHAWGLLEYIVTTLKRCSHHTLHLENGQKLEGVTIILKALGLLGDYAVDKLHNMKQMVGDFCDGDFRRVLHIDATGMNASKFEALSTGIFTVGFINQYKFYYDYPKEFYRVVDLGMMKDLPTHKEQPEFEKPAYVCDVKYAMSAGVVHNMYCKHMGEFLAEKNCSINNYKYRMYHKAHGIRRTLEVANFEWDRYQADWKARGHEHEYVPYPYTYDFMKEWFDEFNKEVGEAAGGCNISIDGPREGDPDLLVRGVNCW